VVHRRAGLGLALAAALLAATPAPAGATSAKVALGDFRWSPMDVTVAPGDSVTWYWVGPDTQHSITALAPATGVDSDPGDNAPQHAAGDRFTVTFDQPGTYEFHCKLHALVRGTVHVGTDPALAGPSPDPDPAVVGDTVAPELTQVRFETPKLLRYTLDEPARVALEVVRLRPGRDRYMGRRAFRGHIGWNRFDFSGRVRDRPLARGRYYAVVTATDAAGNSSRESRLSFRVR
jgi:plastocyanin